MRKYIGTGFVYGVPARDLEEYEWLALTEEQREAAKGLYVRVRKGSEIQIKQKYTKKPASVATKSPIIAEPKKEGDES